MGCYALEPIRTSPVPGTEIGLYMNDAGRSALAPSMGPEIDLIKGRLLESSDGEYLVAVTAVDTFRGGEQIWSGEKVRIKTEYVLSASERHFSKGRTIAATVAGAGIAAYLVNNVAAGLFFGGDDTPTPGDTSSTRRIPRRIPIRIPR